MILRPLTNGAVSGSHTLIVKSGIIGGVLITTDNTNATTVTVRREGSTWMPIINIATVTTMWIGGPFGLDDSETAHVVVSGTGASAQIYEWVP